MKPKDIEGILKVSNAMIKKNVEEVAKRIDKSEMFVASTIKDYTTKAEKAIERAEKTKDGKDGTNGKDGKNGIDGKDGTNGRDGKNGLNGRDGRDGKDGIGKQGIQGKDGVKGDDGDSAYRVAAKNGYKGTEKEWLESLKAEVNMIPNQAVAGYTNPLPPRGTTGQVLAKKSNQDRDYEWIDGGGDFEETELHNDRLITKDPTGFTNNDSINVSYDSTTKKITLTGDFQAYCRGNLIAELVSGWQSPAIVDAVPSGAYFLKYTPTGFVFDIEPFDFSCLQIAYVYYRTDGTYLFSLRETHGFMDWQSHKEFHQTIGTYKTDGGVLTGYTPQSTVATNRRPDTPSTTIKDEDLITVNPEHTSKSYTIAYLQSNGAITSDFNNTEIVRPQTGIPNYNLFSGGVWSQAPMNDGQNTRYMSMWQYAKPVGSDAGSVRYQYVWLQGQSVGDLASQQNANPSDLNFGALATIVPELVFINQAIIRYRANPTNDWDIYQVKELSGNKLAQTSSSSAGFLSTVAHDATLTGDGTVSSPLSVVSNLSVTATDIKMDGVQSLGVLTTLPRADHVHPKDTTKQDTLVSNSNIKTVGGQSILGAGDIAFPSAGVITRYNNTLTADVSIAVANTWYTGATLTLPAGTYLVMGHTTVLRPTTTAVTFSARISDGTNHYASAGQYMPSVTTIPTNLAMTTVITLVAQTNILLQATGNQTGTIKAALTVNAAGNTATQLSAIKLA